MARGLEDRRSRPASDDGPFAVDTLGLPENNPWLCQMRLTGFDFLDGGRQAAVCTWDGDVWLVSGLDAASGELSWQRIASGLFQPLGLKVRDGNIFVACRDQIVILRDLNGDGETDFYENFNSDHQVTEHFHEFAMDLQTDADGNFYYAKAARHGKTALVPQHGTLLRVSQDGLRTEILATGFRAPNGVCLNDDGTFFLTDQEGFWTPKNRINHVKLGGFYGNMWGYHDVTDPSDAAMEPPVCWITNDFDRSPAELVRVTSDAWGPLKGSLLEPLLRQRQGLRRALRDRRRRHAGRDVRLADPRVADRCDARAVPPEGRPALRLRHVRVGRQPDRPRRVLPHPGHRKADVPPSGLHATKNGIANHVHRSNRPRLGLRPIHYSVKTWSLKRSANYGSQALRRKDAQRHRGDIVRGRPHSFPDRSGYSPDVGNGNPLPAQRLARRAV